MAVPTSYLTSTKNLRPILDAMQRAAIPKKVTYDFLKQLGYPSSTDRPVLAVLKALGLLSEGGEPTERYRRFKEPAQSGGVLAEGMREAYRDVFTVDQKANERNQTDLKGIFARLSEKGDSVNEKMAATFKALAQLADFSTTPPSVSEGDRQVNPEAEDAGEPEAATIGLGSVALHHDVHLHLPATTEIGVYDAIFRSLREHLLP